jgi:hypothetical protein
LSFEPSLEIKTIRINESYINETYQGQVDQNNLPAGIGRFVPNTGSVREGVFSGTKCELNGFGRLIYNECKIG